MPNSPAWLTHCWSAFPSPSTSIVVHPQSIPWTFPTMSCRASLSDGYSSGLKWNEEDKLKADMMNRPARWQAITVDQLRARCRELGLKPNDIDTIAGFLQRRKDGRRRDVST